MQFWNQAYKMLIRSAQTHQDMCTYNAQSW